MDSTMWRMSVSRPASSVSYLASAGAAEGLEGIEDSKDAVAVPGRNDLDLGFLLVRTFVRQEFPEEELGLTGT